MKQKQKQSQKQTVIVNVGVAKKAKRSTRKPSGGRRDVPIMVQQVIPPIPLSVQPTSQPDFASQFIKALASMGEGIPAVKGNQINPQITLNNPNVARETTSIGTQVARPWWRQEQEMYSTPGPAQPAVSEGDDGGFNEKNIRDITSQMMKVQDEEARGGTPRGKEEAVKSPYSYSMFGTPILSTGTTPGGGNTPFMIRIPSEPAQPTMSLPSQPAQPSLSMSSAEAIAKYGPPVGSELDKIMEQLPNLPQDMLRQIFATGQRELVKAGPGTDISQLPPKLQEDIKKGVERKGRGRPKKQYDSLELKA